MAALQQSTMLAAALGYASKGKPVFPCGPDKTPLTTHGFKDATTDQQQIRAWWGKQYPNALIGMPTGEITGIDAVDVDINKDKGYDGNDALFELEKKNNKLPDTIESLTPRGGRHLLFKHSKDIRCSNGKVGLGIDIKGDGGYIILPPSGVNGHRYAWEGSNPSVFADMPAWLSKEILLAQGSTKKPSSNVAGNDGIIAEGGRNQHLASLAGSMRRRGMSVEAMEAALLAENTSRCDPPLDADEVQTIARSVGRYEPAQTAQTSAAGAAGNDQPMDRESAAKALRDGYHHPSEPDHPRATHHPEPPPRWGESDPPPMGEAAPPDPTPIEVGNLPAAWLDEPPLPRRYLLEDVLPRAKVGLYVAPGGTGKGWTLLQLAVGAATGLPVFGRWDVAEPGAVLLLAGEDEPEELHRRLYTIYQATITDPTAGDIRGALLRRLYLHSVVGQDPLLTVVDPATGDVFRTAYMERLIATARAIPDLALIILDPVSRFRGGEENDSRHATAFVEALEYIAQETGATVLVAHHTNKASQGHDGSMAQAAARGSSALTDGVRWQANLATMTDKQAKDYGIDPEDRRRYVRLEVPKNNYAPPIEGLWLERQPGGYLVAVDLEPVPAPGRRVPDENYVPAVVKLVRKELEDGREYSPRQFADRFFGKEGRIGISNHQLRHVVEIAIKQKKLRLVDSQKTKREGFKVLALPVCLEVI